MPVCSYLVFARPGSVSSVRRHLSSIPGCEVHLPEHDGILLLVTDTPTVAEDDRLRNRIEENPEIECIALAFGEIGEGAAEDTGESAQ